MNATGETSAPAMAGWAGRRVLVTGHTGFKGAWLTLWLEHLGAEVVGLALPPDDIQGAFTAFGPWPDLNWSVVDLRDGPAVAQVTRDADPHVILHLGAQSLVRRGYADPHGTWAVNVMGTANLLQAARDLPSLQSVVVVTSDKVYANSGDGRAFGEGDPLGGHDPYSSSKAGAEILTAAWRRSYFGSGQVGVATARAGNVVGGGDRGDDRLLPDVWRALEADRPVRLRYPRATRPWQFVLEPLHGYLLLADALARRLPETPGTVNFGPDVAGCMPVSDVVERVLASWGGGHWEQEPGDHPAEAACLTLDSTLASDTLGWRPRLSLETALDWTTDWWRTAAAGGDVRKLALRQIEAYEELLQR
ncbi:MAG: CDP-glucose 4,6-dehydratase [Actinomycetota bacterium]|jgi:CDP-glucose 4,6-dehydratase|nr:CDP-glucose 4,6-dehydratase [Actinomycetota bacterium]